MEEQPLPPDPNLEPDQPAQGLTDELNHSIRKFLERLRVRFIYQLRRVLPPASIERRAEVQISLRESSTPNFDFFVLVFLSCIIATYGLLSNSAATIIGAMLVAPLMSPIIGLGLASIRGDALLFRNAILALAQGALIAIVLSAIITWFNDLVPVVSFQDLPQEVISRTQPSPSDLAIALAGGLAATFALVQPNLSAALPGVAIATALMPPLCAVGVCVALGDWKLAAGAILLFVTNAVTIAAASILLFYTVGFTPPRREGEERVPRSLRISLILTALLLLPLGWQSYSFVKQVNLNRQVQTVVSEESTAIGAELADLEWSENEDILEINTTMLVPNAISHTASVELQDAIAQRLQRSVQLRINQVIASRLNPSVPPTHTPTASPGATLTPSITPIPVTPTITTTITPTDTPVPTLTFTPTTVSALLDDIPGEGVNLRTSPGGASIAYLPRGSQLTILYGYQIVDGWVWVEVQDAQGRVGWLPLFYISTLPPPEQLDPTASSTPQPSSTP